MKHFRMAWICGLMLVSAPLAAQQKKPAPAKVQKTDDCQLELVYSEHVNSTDPMLYLSGDVRLACVGRDVTLASDSIISFGNFSVVTAINHVKYHDEKYDILADTLRRYEPDTLRRPRVGERIQAVGHVHITDRKSGSTLVGPAVDFIRAAAGTKDSDRVIAFNHPTATLRDEKTAKDKTPPSPYLISAERLMGWGSDKINAYGTVTIEHDSLRASGDSVTYLTGKTKMARIFGLPAKVERSGKDSVRLEGRDILLGFTADEKLKDVKASGDGKVFRDQATIAGDTLLLGLKAEVLTSITAWDRAKRAHLQREGYDAFADSLVVDSKDDHISELRLFGKGKVFQPIDSTALPDKIDSLASKDRDWLSGQRMVVSFRQADSAGTSLTMVDRLVANKGSTKLPSCSFVSNRPPPTPGKTTSNPPTINYACADAITVRMKSGLTREVEDVALRGNVNGMQLERTVSAATVPAVPPVIRP